MNTLANTIVNYFKTRALRQITQWLIVAAFSILTLGVFAVADAYAQSPTYKCSDLEGTSVKAGACIIDGGCVDFDLKTSPLPAGEICAPEKIDKVPVGTFELHGWIKDLSGATVSLYCGNAGSDCKTIPYGVKINPLTGEMSGWAWSEQDDIHWISFMCKSGKNEGKDCGGIDYGTKINLTIGADLGKITGSAWADDINGGAGGYFKFNGSSTAHAHLLNLLMQKSITETDWGVWTKAEIKTGEPGDPALTPAQKNATPTKDTMPFTTFKKNSGPGYDLFVHIADITGKIVYEGAGLTVNITTTWKDTVKFDQTSTTAENFSDNSNGPVKKPATISGQSLKVSSQSTTGGIKNSYWNVVRSAAPTDGGNCLDGDGDKSCYGGEGTGDFLYKDFGEGVTDNSLIYWGATITIIIDATGETWTIPVLRPLENEKNGKPMEFKPIVDILELNYLFTPGTPKSGLPFIQAIRNKVSEFFVDATDNKTTENYSVTFKLSTEEPDVNYVFIDDLETDPNKAESNFLINNDDAMPLDDKLKTLNWQLLALPFSPSSEANFDQIVEGSKLTSVVNIKNSVTPGADVTYYNNGLPRGDVPSKIQTQSAEIISGGVSSSGAKNVVVGSDVPLFGDTSVYELRSQILADVSGLIRGIPSGTNTSPVIICNPAIPGCSPADLKENTFKGNRFYYFENKNVTIEDISMLVEAGSDKPVTVVVKGGDLYIKNNVDMEGQEFGFIVFESDDAVDSSGTTKGGRIYIHSDVTDLVNVHMFTDGPVFRYADNVCYYWDHYKTSDGKPLTGLREPNFVTIKRCSTGSTGSFKEPLSALPNQFYLKGNIASFNCLGCSTDIAPSRGDGVDLGGPSASNFAIARLYDFNYFSYFRENLLKPGTFSGERSSNVTALEVVGKIPDGDKAVYFEYSPAPTDLLGFRNF
jgi:hypothetical protein